MDNLSERHKVPGTPPDVAKHSDSTDADGLESRLSSSEVDDYDGETTLYNKKCVLVNRQIDAMGMGRYQWYVWTLCGMGYVLDLLWALAFGLVLSPLQQELGFGNDKSGNISVAFSAGLTAGAFVWGVLVDILGRQWSFNLTVLFTGAFGITLGSLDSYTSFLVITAFVGFGVGGNIPIDTTIVLEFIPQNKRFLLALLSVFQPVGYVLAAAIAYGFIPSHSCSPNFTAGDDALPSCRNVVDGTPCCTKASNMGWRYVMYTTGAISLAVFALRFVIFNFRESPKFLIYRGHDEKAIRVLEQVADFNGSSCTLSMADFDTLSRTHSPPTPSSISTIPILSHSTNTTTSPSTISRLRLNLLSEAHRLALLFSTPTMTRLTLLVWLTYICDFSAFTITGTYLPRILALKNAHLDKSLTYTYRSYIYIYLPAILGVAVAASLYRAPRVGRKFTLAASAALMAVSIFVFAAVNTPGANIAASIAKYFFQLMFNAVLYGWTPETFPAPVRGTACGLASFWGRLSGIVSPLVAQHLYARVGTGGGEGDANAVLYLAGGVMLGCVVTTLLLPGSVVGKDSL
ncbi:MFS general substrate transporter [Pseudovirgaria hyperparasitica]|uniref:MFS general substrate transporter n=1 Tax=Pseudovirgaria hyperparasitica TaxID=470096 RepID=A0A6A6WDN4_9PEZI|nr:MFS general substrate transporter [Pseudovirgaria hyperparasitica]KAF2760823.1 MFS general substrate transporter [Pseudovirgaria hyperparasitica]